MVFTQHLTTQLNTYGRFWSNVFDSALTTTTLTIKTSPVGKSFGRMVFKNI